MYEGLLYSFIREFVASLVVGVTSSRDKRMRVEIRERGRGRGIERGREKEKGGRD